LAYVAELYEGIIVVSRHVHSRSSIICGLGNELEARPKDLVNQQTSKKSSVLAFPVTTLAKNCHTCLSSFSTSRNLMLDINAPLFRCPLQPVVTVFCFSAEKRGEIRRGINLKPTPWPRPPPADSNTFSHYSPFFTSLLFGGQ
jgi:hypothetical protein